jgi:hypothetical protein
MLNHGSWSSMSNHGVVLYDCECALPLALPVFDCCAPALFSGSFNDLKKKFDSSVPIDGIEVNIPISQDLSSQFTT